MRSAGIALRNVTGVITMIDAVDDDIVDIEHQVAVGLFENSQQELAFAH